MIVNINPSACDFDETQHALLYASAARTVRVGGRSNNSNNNNNSNSTLQHSSNSNSNSAMEYGYDGRRRCVVVDSTNENIKNNTNTQQSGHRAGGGGMANQCVQKIRAVIQKLSPKKKNPSDPRGKRVQVLPPPHEPSKRVRVHPNSPQPHVSTIKDFHSAQVRGEILDEINGQLQAMKLQSSDTSSSSTSAHDIVAELLETVQECEGEMVRMRDRHAIELAQQQSRYERALRDQNWQRQQQQDLIDKLEQQVQALSLPPPSGKQVIIAAHNANLEQQLQAKVEHIAALHRRIAALEQEMTSQHFHCESQNAVLRHDIEQLQSERNDERETSFSLQQQQQQDDHGWSADENELPADTLFQQQQKKQQQHRSPGRMVLGNTSNDAAARQG